MSPSRLARIESGIRLVLDFNSAFNRHDIAVLTDLIRDDCIFETSGPAPDGKVFAGKKDIIKYWQDFFQYFKQANNEIEEIYGFGNRCILRWKFVWAGEFEIDHLRGVDIFKVEDNLICEKLSYIKG